MTFTATPEPANDPPRVFLEIDSEESGATFTSLTVTRNGDPILQQPLLGAATAEVYDYLAPFDQAVEYIADGAYLPFVAPTWTENWASLAAWTGDTGSWSLGAGDTVESTAANVAITRTTGGTIQRMSVTDPDHVRVEVLTTGDVVVASVAVTTNVVLTGTTSTSVAGTGSFELNLTDGTVTAAGTGWSLSRPYTGTPSKVRLVSLGGNQELLSDFDADGPVDAMAVAASGNIYTLSRFVSAGSVVRKYNSAGALQTSWSLPSGSDDGDIAVDSSENVYATKASAGRVYKYNSSGTALTNWDTVENAYGVGVDSSNNVYTINGYGNSRIYKWSNTGTAITNWLPATSEMTRLDVNATTDVIVVAGQGEDTSVYRYDTSGTQIGTFSLDLNDDGDTYSVASDAAGNIYISDKGEIRKFTSAGTEIGGAFEDARATALDPTSGELLLGDRFPNKVYRYASTPMTVSVGTIVATPLAGSVSYREVISTTLDVDEAWLMHPAEPSLSVSIDAGPNAWRDDGINVAIESAQSVVARASQTVHYPIGRARGVTISHGNRLDDEWSLVLNTPRLEDRDAVQAILRDQTPLLVRSPADFGWDLPDGFYAVQDVQSDRPFAPLQYEDRRITLPLIPSDPPVVRPAPERSYGDLLLEAATYSDLLAMYDTYTDLLAGSES